MRYEYKVLLVVVIIVAAILTVIVSFETALCFLLGAVMSGSAGWIGMRIATSYNFV